MTLTLSSACALHPQVALRPEPFGALAYHYGNRRVVVLKHPDGVRVGRELWDRPSVGQSLRACGMGTERDASFLQALDQLTKSEILRVCYPTRYTIKALSHSTPLPHIGTPLRMQLAVRALFVEQRPTPRPRTHH